MYSLYPCARARWRAALLIFGLCPVAAWSQSITFNELVSRAVETNRELLSVRQRADEAAGLLRQAAVKPAPVLQGGGVTGRPLGTVGEEQFSASVSKTIERGGKRDRRIEIAEREADLAAAQYAERVRQLRYGLRSRFVDLASSAARLRILDEQLANLHRALDLTHARVAQGDAAKLESDLLSVEIGRLEVQRVALAGSIETIQTDLRRIAGLAVEEAVQVSPAYSLPPDRPAQPELVNRALMQRPDLQFARVREDQGDAERRLAEAEGKPDVTVSGGYAFVKSRFDDQRGFDSSGALVQLRDRDDVLSVTVSIPLFGRGRNQGNIEAAVARTRASQLQREALERSIPLEVSAALRRLQSTEQSLQILDGSVLIQATSNVQVVQQAYELGQLRLLDVLNEQRRLLDLRNSKIDTEAEVLRSWAELEKAVGGQLQ